jgi:hypothetical protein
MWVWDEVLRIGSKDVWRRDRIKLDVGRGKRYIWLS